MVPFPAVCQFQLIPQDPLPPTPSHHSWLHRYSPRLLRGTQRDAKGIWGSD